MIRILRYISFIVLLLYTSLVASNLITFNDNTLDKNNPLNEVMISSVEIHESNDDVIIFSDQFLNNLWVYHIQEEQWDTYSIPTYGSFLVGYDNNIISIYLYRENSLITIENNTIHVVETYDLSETREQELEASYKGGTIYRWTIARNIKITTNQINVKPLDYSLFSALFRFTFIISITFILLVDRDWESGFYSIYFSSSKRSIKTIKPLYLVLLISIILLLYINFLFVVIPFLYFFIKAWSEKDKLPKK